MNIATSFAKHEAVRDSGTEWLGAIPSNWAVKKMKFLFRDYSRKGMPDAELLSVTQNQGVVPRTWVENRMVMPSGNLESFKFIEEGDFAISLRSFEGGLEYCHHDGIISPAYTVLKRRSEHLLPTYYRYLFKSAAFISELQTSVVGIREGKNISFEELSYSLMPIPDASEQRAIAAFLDGKCATIDEAVRIKEEQITLLRERRQILIQQAVTRGLNPAAPMKDSGIDWIGQIPAHWNLAKLKFLANKIVDGTHFTPEYLDEGVPFLRVTDLSKMKDGKIQWDSVRRISETAHKELSKRANAEFGDVLLSKNGTIGLTKVIDWQDEFSFFVSLCLIKLRSELNPHYFEAFFNSPLVDQQLFFGSFRTSVTNLHLERIKELVIVVPPINEQSTLVSHIRELSRPLDEAISLKQNQIAALKEYKTSLINAAVTGKIKVI